MPTSSRVWIGKIPVDRISLDDVLNSVANALKSRSRKTFFYANSHAITLAESDGDFANAMRKADAIFCDGFGVYLASRVLGSAVPQRFTPPDWIDMLAAICRSNGASMFFLGATEGVADDAARRVEARNPGVRVHSHHGHFPKTDSSSREVVALVNGSGASVLLVGFGMPLQESWITQHRSELEPVIVFAVGGMFDLVAGTVPRGPRWLTDHGFEWLTRLATEPKRLWRRYLIGLPRFALLVVRQRLTGPVDLPAHSQ